LDVPLVQAAQNVVPVAVTAGVYSRPEGGSGGRVRRVVRESGVN